MILTTQLARCTVNPSRVGMFLTLSFVYLVAACSGGSGPNTTTPTDNLDDTVSRAIGPGGGTVVTPSGAAGVDIPAGTFSEQVTVRITRLPRPQSPGTGPLPTDLKQYGPFYDFTTSPQLAQFGDSVRVGVCQVTDPSSSFYAPEPHDRLRLAHTVGSSIEILDRVGANDFLRCTNVSASNPASRLRWRRMLASFAGGVLSTINPAQLYAAHGGLAGKVKSFSPFGAVDIGAQGTFTLRTIDGRDLPLITVSAGSEFTIVNAGTMTINIGNTFGSTLNYTTSGPGGTTAKTKICTGTFTRNGTAFTFTETNSGDPQCGATYSGTWDNVSTLTVGYVANFFPNGTAVYQK